MLVAPPSMQGVFSLWIVPQRSKGVKQEIENELFNLHAGGQSMSRQIFAWGDREFRNVYISI